MAIKIGMEYKVLSEELVDKLQEVVTACPELHKAALEFSIKEATERLEQFDVDRIQLDDPDWIASTDLACDYYWKWFHNLFAAAMTRNAPYPEGYLEHITGE
jgi:methionine synthase II (cobalamin-independent)